MSVLMTVVSTLAEAPPPADVDPTTGQGAEWGKGAPIGLFVILVMCIAVFFMLRSMTRNIRKVPSSFEPAVATDEADPSGEQDVDGAADEVAAGPTDPDQLAPGEHAEQEPADRSTAPRAPTAG